MTNELCSLPHLVMEAITQAVIAETVIYGGGETTFVEGKILNFDVRLNCKTLQFNVTGLDRWRNQSNPGTTGGFYDGHWITPSAWYRERGRRQSD